VAGAQVTATPVSGGPPHAGQTNKEGIVIFSRIPAGDYRVLAVDHASGTSGGTTAHVEANKSQGVEITFSSGQETGGNLGVRVTLDGIPVENADVIATPVGGGESFSGQTDGDGTVSFDGIPAGDYQVSAQDPASDATGSGSAHVEVETSAGVDISLNYVEQRVGDLGVRVVDSDGNPVAGVEVTVSGGGQSFHGTTDGDGQVVFERIPVGDYGISASDPPTGRTGSDSARVEADTSTPSQITLSPGEQ
jgi:hypothetical protein